MSYCLTLAAFPNPGAIGAILHNRVVDTMTEATWVGKCLFGLGIRVHHEGKSGWEPEVSTRSGRHGGSRLTDCVSGLLS